MKHHNLPAIINREPIGGWKAFHPPIDLYAFRYHFTSRDNLEEMEKEFQTFLRTARKIFDKVGGEFCNEKMEQAIPGNKWMVFHDTCISSLFPELMKKSRFVRSKKDQQKLCADAIKKAKRERVMVKE